MLRISPVWALLSVLFAFGAIRAPKSVPLPAVLLGMFLVCLGAYLVGRAEEHYAYTHAKKSIRDRFRHPMYLGSFLILAGAATALKSPTAGLIAVFWGLGALYLGWRESHSDTSDK
ncbi:hypothetical protein HPY42_01660 [Coprothermobacteraceae bacterium]|nr:hypothetical protein [Coprothermobacteraceae bacterium]